MMKPMLAVSIAALSAVCLAMAPQGARAGGPCGDSCDLAAHMAAMHGMTTNAVVAMDAMPGMSGMGSPAPASPQPAGAPHSAAADAMLQTMNDTHMAHGPHMQM